MGALFEPGDEAWFKSTVSEGMGECVEVAFLTVVSVRDSKNPDGFELLFTAAEWRAFIQGVKDGEFDLP